MRSYGKKLYDVMTFRGKFDEKAFNPVHWLPMGTIIFGASLFGIKTAHNALFHNPSVTIFPSERNGKYHAGWEFSEKQTMQMQASEVRKRKWHKLHRTIYNDVNNRFNIWTVPSLESIEQEVEDEEILKGLQQEMESPSMEAPLTEEKEPSAMPKPTISPYAADNAAQMLG